MIQLKVRLGQRSYPIVIGSRLENLGPHLAHSTEATSALIITNTTVKKLYCGRLEKGLASAGLKFAVKALPDGEKYKNLDTVAGLYTAALEARLDRRSVIIALGGGVVGDIAGFVAATFMRGIGFVQAPTTLLAMVDSSVGGKTGVDLKAGKNLVGAFYQPRAVWADTSTLATLPAREIENGLAEVIKYGVIADGRFFGSLEKIAGKGRITPAEYETVIERCCRIKAGVVARDEREEKGVREILNFGHTFGHAIETLTGYETYSHGEAVAMGMVCAGRLAVRLGMFSGQAESRIEALVSRAGLPLSPAKKLNADKLIALMRKDKKAHNGMMRFVLPVRIGSVVARSGVPEKIIREVLTW